MIPLITWRWSRHRPHRLLLTGNSGSSTAHSPSIRSECPNYGTQENNQRGQPKNCLALKSDAVTSESAFISPVTDHPFEVVRRSDEPCDDGSHSEKPRHT